MGTRSLTKVIRSWENESGEKESRPITCMYRQYDGHIDSHGVDLAEFLEDFSIVNGIPLKSKIRIANGMDCLAAQMFAHFKDGPGNIYCQHPDTEEVWEDYQYEIEKDQKHGIMITVYSVWDGKKKIFHGTPRELLNHVSELA